MTTAHEIRNLIEQTTTGIRRKNQVIDPVRLIPRE
jgi:hypothetical protein